MRFTLRYGWINLELKGSLHVNHMSFVTWKHQILIKILGLSLIPSKIPWLRLRNLNNLEAFLIVFRGRPSVVLRDPRLSPIYSSRRSSVSSSRVVFGSSFRTILKEYQVIFVDFVGRWKHFLQSENLNFMWFLPFPTSWKDLSVSKTDFFFSKLDWENFSFCLFF